MIRRDHEKGYVWNHNQPHNQDGLINFLIKADISIDEVINDFKRSLPNYSGNHRSRVLGHLRHLKREHEDFPYNIMDGYIKKKI